MNRSFLPVLLSLVFCLSSVTLGAAGLSEADRLLAENARALLDQERDEAAWSILAPLAKRYPEHPLIQRRALSAAHGSEELDDAWTKRLIAAAESEEATWDARVLAALAAFYENDLDTAWPHAHLAADERADDALLQTLLGHLRLQLRDRKGATEHAERALDIDPGFASAALLLDSRLPGDKHDARIVMILERVVEARPLHLRAILALRERLESLGDRQRADELLELARTINPDSEALRSAETARLWEQGDFDALVASYRSRLEEDSAQDEVIVDLARAHAFAGRAHVGLAHLEEALLERPDARRLRWSYESVHEHAEQALRTRSEELPAFEDAPADMTLEDIEHPVVFFVDDPDTGWSERLRAQVLADEEVVAALSQLDLYRIEELTNSSLWTELRERAETWKAPLLIAWSPDQSELARVDRDALPKAAAEELDLLAQRLAAEERPGASGPSTWHDQLDAALEEAKQREALVLAYARGSGPWAEEMDAVLKDPSLAPSLRDAVLYRTSDASVGEHAFSVTPSVLFLDGEGRTVHVAAGYRKASRLANDMEHAKKQLAKGTPPLPAPEWLADVDFALERAVETGRTVVMDIYTDWCGPCKEMERSTFADATLIRTLNEAYVPLKLNPDVDAEAGERYSPGKFPTNYVVHASGRILREVNSRDPEGYAEELDASEQIRLLDELGPEGFERRSRTLRAMENMNMERMYASFFFELDRLGERPSEYDASYLTYFAQRANRYDLAESLAREAFFEGDEPSSGQASQVVTWTVKNEAPQESEKEDEQARNARYRRTYEALVRECRGRQAHEAAARIAYASFLHETVGDKEEARAQARRAERLGAKGVGPLRVGWALSEGDEPEALRLAKDVALTDSRQAIAVAWLLEDAGRVDDAAERYASLAESSPYAGNMANWYAELLSEPEQKEQARKMLPEVLHDAARLAATVGQLTDDSAYALNEAGYRLARMGERLDEAEAMLERAIEIARQEGDSASHILDSLAWAQHKKGDHARALDTMMASIEEGGPVARFDHERRYHLGAIYAALGFEKLACDQLESVVSDKEPEEDDTSNAAEAWRLVAKHCQ